MKGVTSANGRERKREREGKEKGQGKLLTLWNFGIWSLSVIRNTIIPNMVPISRNIGANVIGPMRTAQTGNEDENEMAVVTKNIFDY